MDQGVAGAAQSGRVSVQALAHCTVAQAIRLGRDGVTNDGHTVKRLSQTEWKVLEAPEASRYDSGAVVPSRVLFFRMNGLAAALQ